VKELIVLILGLIGGVFGILFFKGDIQFKKKENFNEMENKSANDIVNGLDNSGDVERVKKESTGKFDSEFNRRKKEKRRNLLDRFRS